MDREGGRMMIWREGIGRDKSNMIEEVIGNMEERWILKLSGKYRIIYYCKT